MPLNRQAKRNLRKVADRTTRKLREDCPVRSGKMRRSISRRQSGNEYDIGARVDYRYYVRTYRAAVRRARRAATRMVDRESMTITTQDGTHSGPSYIDVSLADRRTAIKLKGDL